MHYDAEASFDDIVLPPARRVLDQIDPGTVRYLIYAYAAHGATGAPADTAQRLCRSLGLRSATAFAITQQNCAIPLTAIDLAGTLLTASGDPDARALIVTGEKLTPHQARQLNTVMLADGAASCLVSTNGRGGRVLSFATRTRGEYYDGLQGSRAQFRAAAEERPKLLREVMTEAATEAGYRLSDLQLIVPPNQGLPFWGGTLDSAELVDKAFFDNNARHSHCLAADLFINYATLTRQRRWQTGRPSLFVATGLGWTYSAMVLLPVPATARPAGLDSAPAARCGTPWN
jgi:3-oxoacyl-[acyl-carrier-protein] synthase-3